MDFNHQFDFVYRSLRQRLAFFTSIEKCGHWNAFVLDDLRSDLEFNRAAEELHEWIVEQSFGRDKPTTDGLEILNVKIDFEKSICVGFRLWFFVDCKGTGHSASPSRFSVMRSADDESVYRASVGCGLRDKAGRFWYPRNDPDYGRFDTGPDRDDEWAYYRAKTFGDGTLSNWMKARGRILD